MRKRDLKEVIVHYIIVIIFFLFFDLFILKWSITRAIIFMVIFTVIFFTMEFLILKMRLESYTKKNGKIHLIYSKQVSIFGFVLLLIGVVFLVASIFAFLKFSEKPPLLVIIIFLFSIIFGLILIWLANIYSKNLNKSQKSAKKRRFNLLVVVLLLISLISFIVPDVFSIDYKSKIIEGKQLGEALKINLNQKTQPPLELGIPQQESSQKIKYIQMQETGLYKQDIKRIGDNLTFPSILNQTKIETFDIFDIIGENKRLESSIKTTFQIPVSNVSPKASYQKAEKSKISNFIIPETKFPFQEKKEQPIITPTLEETITIKANNEVKKKREAMANISFDKTIPKMIGQRGIGAEEITERLEKDSKFKEMYNYAKELGYNKINNSIEARYSNDKSALVTTLISDNETFIFLMKVISNEIEKSFLAKFENKNGTAIFTMFDREGGVIFDMLNKSVLSSWGPHGSCGYWTCITYANEYMLDQSWLYEEICGSMCDTCTHWMPIPYQAVACVPCGICIAGFAAYMLTDCALDSCSWYPCLADCNDYDGYYNNPWEYYCKGSDRYKHRKYYDYYCPTEVAREGSCQYNINYVDDTFVQSCPYGCNNATGNCMSEVTCYNDLECGQDTWVGSPYCSGGDVWQYYKEYNCHYPGTENSYCTPSQSPILKQDCIGGTCENGICVGDVFCKAQNPNYPYYCSSTPTQCYSCSDNDLWNVCCPDSGSPTTCCPKSGPYCDTSSGECSVCGGNYPIECNNSCWGINVCPGGFGLCCPSSGNPQWCCNSTASMCMPDGSCCAPTQETCNNQDDDCNGVIDNFSEGCGVGTCAGGTRTCTAGNWGACSTAGNPINETCNNVDDDCDGSVDEDLTQECGSDIGECVKGNQTCYGGYWEVCGGNYVGPVNETCDGLDNNCNNITDEANVCGNYPNVTLIFPIDNYVDETGNITFNCSVTDDFNLDNITLYHNLNGSTYLEPNETKTITGINTSETWTIDNIDISSYMWNCLAYDNDSHWSWSENGPFSFTVTIPGLTNTFSDGDYTKNLSFDEAGKQTPYLRVPKNANVINATLNITGYNKTYVEHYYWINWTSGTHNFDGGVTIFSMSQTPDGPPPSGYLMNYLGSSKYNGTFTLNTVPEDVLLSITHLTSSGEQSYSPVNITVNGQLVEHCFDPGSTGYITHNWDITQYAQQGTNVIESVLCTNASTPYWIKWLDINSSFELYPLSPSLDVGGDLDTEWNYSGEFGITENTSDFSQEINDYLNGIIAHDIVNDEGDGGGMDVGVISIGYYDTYCNWAFYEDCSNSLGVMSTEEVFNSSKDISVDKIALNVEKAITDSSWFVYNIYICDVDSDNVRYNTETNCNLVYNNYNFSSSFGTGWNNITLQNTKNLSKGQLYEIQFLYNNSGSGTDFIRIYSDYPKSGYRYFIYKWDEETSHNLYDLYRNIIFYGEPIESVPGKIDIPLIFSSESVGILGVIDIRVYYEIIDEYPNVILANPNNNYISETGNITFICNVSDDNGLSNITLYTDITGTWRINETKEISGTSNSTEFTIENIPDETSFIWNCLAYDNISQLGWGDTNRTINISFPNTAPIVINLTQYPTSVYRGQDIEIRCAIHDNETTNSSLNISIQYQNTTNNGYIECVGITYDFTNNWWKCNYTTNYSDDDLGSFDFRCNVSDGKLSSGWTTNIDAVTVLNNPPIIYSCKDAHIYEDTPGSGVQIDLDDCSSDVEDIDSNLVYQINNQTNTSLINCYINDHNITCNNPTQHQYGYSYLEVQVNDTDSGINISSPLILISVNAFPDASKFYIKNSSQDNVAWFGNEGNIVLKGKCNVMNDCTSSSENSFVIGNSTDDVVAYINSTGDLCIEKGSCSSSTSCVEKNAFKIRNYSQNIVNYIDFDGELCFTGGLYENSNP